MYFYVNMIKVFNKAILYRRLYMGHKWPKFEIPNEWSETVNQRTNNTMAKRKRTKWQTMIYKTLHRKLKIEQRTPVKTGGFHHCQTGLSYASWFKNIFYSYGWYMYCLKHCTTSGAGITYPSWSPYFTSVLLGFVLLNLLFFCEMFCRPLLAFYFWLLYWYLKTFLIYLNVAVEKRNISGV
jgi:hypothetical protein